MGCTQTTQQCHETKTDNYNTRPFFKRKRLSVRNSENQDEKWIIDLPNEIVQSSAEIANVQQPHPRLKLTPREIYRLKSSWKAVHRKMVDTGVELFVNLFRTNSEIMSLFSQFRYIDATDATNLRSCEELAKHAEKVMSAIDHAILGLDDVDTVINNLGIIATTHCRFVGFQSVFFWTIEEAFLKAVTITLDDRLSEQLAEIYKKTIRFIISEMQISYDEMVTIDVNDVKGELLSLED